ncbi:MAG: DUF2169 domain-containing protein [Byssovorax sp.]
MRGERSGPPSIVTLGAVASDVVVWRSPTQLHLTLIVKATFRLDETMAQVEPEDVYRAERHDRNNATHSVRRADDLAPLRSRAEVVFTGHAHAPGGQPTFAQSVRLGVFRDHPLVDKTLHVYGDRSSGAPSPFVKMPLVYERAFGGPGWDENPIGVGFAPDKEPNLAAANIVNAADPTRSGGFGPLSRNWRSRRKLLGKTSRKDIEQAIARLPDDFDWSYFHSAPADQRCELLHGDEWLVLDGLLADRPRLEVRLPGARALARVQGLGATEQAVDLRADTLQIDGDDERCSLVWRSTIALREEAQIQGLAFVVGVELPGAPIAWPAPAPLSRRAPPPEGPPRARLPLPALTDLEPPQSPFEGTIALDDAVEVKRPATPFLAGAATPPPPRAPAPEPPPESPFEGTLAVDPDELEARSKRPATPFKAASPWSIPSATLAPGGAPPPRAPKPDASEAASSDPEATMAVSEEPDVRKAPVLPFRSNVARPGPDVAARPAAPIEALPPALAPLPPLPARLVTPRPATTKAPGTAQFFHTAPRPLDPTAEPPSPRERELHPGSAPRKTVVAGRVHDAIPIVNGTTLVAFSLPLQPRPAQDARAVVIKGTFDLVPDGPAKLRDETELPSGDLHAGDEMMRSVLYPSDFAPFKPRVDVTLKGHAYAPGGSSPASLARFRFGRGSAGFERQIAVFGERTWQQTVVKTAPTEPRRFQRIPIVHELAFGGPGFDRNPMGRGYGAATALPCLEDPARLITSPADTPEPMSFGAVPMLWRERWSRLGSYAGDWLKTRWPYFPDDFDWAFFQAAPPAQQLDRVQGDEAFEIVGMHPQHPRLDGSLPRLKPRCFAQRTTEAGGELVEVVLRLDTVTIDVDEMKLNLVWRGLIEVRDDEASEIAELFVMVEPLAGAHADLAEARAKYLAAKAPEEPATSAPPASPWPEAASPPPFAASPPSGARLPPHLDPARREVVARLARGESLAQYDAAGADLSDLDFSGRSLAGANFKEALLRRCRFVGADLTGAQLSGADLSDAVLDDANLSLADLTAANLDSARFDRADLTHADLGRGHGERASFREAKGTRPSFAGGVWAKARFDRASIAGADFTSASLDEAVFDGAVMPEIRLYDARATRASFDDATLTEARADGVQLTRCSLKSVSAASSIWDRAVLDETSFRGATLTASGFNKASGARAVFSGADLAGARFERAKFPGASLLKANLMEASLLGADLTSADLRGANLHGADTWKTRLGGAQLELAVLTKTKLKGRA